MDCMLFPAQENNQKENSTHLHEMAVQQTMVRTFSCARKNGMVCISSYRISDSTDCQIVKIKCWAVSRSPQCTDRSGTLRTVTDVVWVHCGDLLKYFQPI